MDSNPGPVYQMELTFSHIEVFAVKLYICLKRPKIYEKEARVGPFLKKIKD